MKDWDWRNTPSLDVEEEKCEGCQGDHEFHCCTRTPQRHSLKEQGSRKSQWIPSHAYKWMEDNQTKASLWYKSTTVHQVWDPWRIDGGIVTIHFILYSTLWTSFSFTLTFTIYSYILTLVLTLAQFTQPCTVCAAMHSSHSHAQFMSLSI